MNVLKAMGPSEECAEQFSEWRAQLLDLVLNKKKTAVHEYQSAHQDSTYFDTKHSRKNSVIVCCACLCTCVGLNIFYAKLVSSMAAHAAFSGTPLSALNMNVTCRQTCFVDMEL